MLASRPAPTRRPSTAIAHRSTRTLLISAILASLLFSAACDSGRGTETDAGSQTKASSSPSVSAHSPASALGVASQEGTNAANYDAVSLEARYTPRAELLKQLATQFGFRVLGRASSEARIDIDVKNVPLEAALAVLLEGEPYALQYAAGSGPGRNIELVLLGDTQQHMNTLRRQRMAKRRKSQNQEVAQERKRKKSDREDKLASLSKEEREVFLEREREEKAEQRREIAEIARTQLYADDPADRVRAIEHLQKGTISEAELAEIALSDPDGSVRGAAIDRMAKSESQEAESTILSALDDPDPRVVIEAIEALEWKDRRSDISKLEPLLDHENEDVRTAAQDAKEYLAL